MLTALFLLTLSPLFTRGQAFDPSSFGLDPDVYRETPDYITSRGFEAETHYVTTYDGYILSIYRVVHPYLDSFQRHSRPVILQHGALTASICWVFNSPGGHVDEVERVRGRVGNNLAFVLAKKGYDVWMPNSRGNSHSKNHSWLDTNTPKYWDFSYDEMIKYDLPAVIEHIQNMTGSMEVSYVGHSLGTMTMLGLLATQPRYNESVKPIILLSPTAFISHQMAIWNPVARIPGVKQLVASLQTSFLVNASPRTLVRTFCSLNRVTQELCTQVLFAGINGFDNLQLNRTRVGIYFGGFMYGLSTKFAAHWLQNIASGRFQMYDYGTSGNMQKYGQPTPPDYPLEKVNPRHVAFFSSVGDALAAPEDVNKLRSHLRGRLLEDYIVPNERWSHGDFLWALDAGKYVNSKILDILKRYPS